MSDSVIQLNQVNLGGRVITVLDGNLKLVNTNFTQNFIGEDTLGIYTAMSSLIIESCTFNNPQSQDSYYTSFINKQVRDLNGGFISIGPNSSV